MLYQILTLYLQSLLATAIFVVGLNGFWLLLRFVLRKDRTLKEKQDYFYDVLLISIMAIPILSFATMTILLVLRV